MQETANFDYAASNPGTTSAVIALIKAAISHEPDPMSKISALHTACYYLNYKAVEMILNRGTNPNMRNFLGKTPLHDAIDHAECTKKVHNPKEILSRQSDIVLDLLASKANPSIPDGKGDTPLTLAIRRNLPKIVSKLLKFKANPDQSVEGFSTLLHYCATKNRADIAKYALKYGANKDATDRNGETPLQVARIYGAAEIVRMLSNHDARCVNNNEEISFDIDERDSQAIRQHSPRFSNCHANNTGISTRMLNNLFQSSLIRLSPFDLS